MTGTRMTSGRGRRPGTPRSIGVWLLAATVGLALGTGGCGDDPPPPPPKRSAKPKAAKAAGPAAAAQGQPLSFYPKIESFVADPEEAKQIRHGFQPTDFEPDLTGDVNRDPFRSFVIRQQGIGTGDRTQTVVTEPTQVCSSQSLVASNYSLRDLRLVGIVLRGTKSYALFRDSASYGHIVKKGDCLGQEKARVAAIRAGFVSLEVIPEAGPNQVPRAPQERAIQLYPEELTVETETR